MSSHNENIYAEQNTKMIRDIEYFVKESAKYTGIYKLSPRLLKAIKLIPRHLFLKDYDKEYAYVNKPISIGYGQTASQPFIIAIMIELLEITKNNNVLEIGTGSGFQTAILSTLAKKIYTVEIIPQLLEDAMKKFKELKFNNIYKLCGNGALGWKENAPFDRIIVSAACKKTPDSLINQLKINGVMVLPLIMKDGTQRLVVINKDPYGIIHMKNIFSVLFVPLI